MSKIWVFRFCFAAGLALLLIDHFSSPPLSAYNFNEDMSACAPCGAPCETK